MIRSRMPISVLLRRSARKTGTNVRELVAVSPRRPRQPVALDAEVVVAEESHRSDDDQPHDQHLVLVAKYRPPQADSFKPELQNPATDHAWSAAPAQKSL